MIAVPELEGFAGRAGSSGLIDRLLQWYDRVRQRRHLQALDEHMLKDIGLTRADAEMEANKPFWVP
jgi:uncharacterized protein YjiS (DUF1127 family)